VLCGVAVGGGEGGEGGGGGGAGEEDGSDVEIRISTIVGSSAQTNPSFVNSISRCPEFVSSSH